MPDNNRIMTVGTGCVPIILRFHAQLFYDLDD